MRDNSLTEVSLEELIPKISSDLSYTVEVDITEAWQPIEDPEEVGPAYAPSDFYRTLTVLGGVNYTENEVNILIYVL